MAQQGETTMLLNANEQAVLTYLDEKRAPATITEMADKCFPHLKANQANSWVRNSLRRLHDKLGLIRKMNRGTYAPALPPAKPAIDIAAFQGVIVSAVRRTALGLSDEDVADLVQQVNEKLLHKLPSYDKERGAVSNFIWTVARSTTLDVLRSRARQPFQTELDEHPVDADDALAVMMRQEQEQLVRDCIAALDDADREFAMACMADDFDIAAHAKQTGVLIETLYVRKHRLVQKIGAALRNRLAA